MAPRAEMASALIMTNRSTYSRHFIRRDGDADSSAAHENAPIVFTGSHSLRDT